MIRELISIDNTSGEPVYLQISNAFIQKIKEGRLLKGLKLPGSRTNAALQKVNRMTVVAALNELDAQGWIEMVARQGTFIKTALPVERRDQLCNLLQTELGDHVSFKIPDGGMPVWTKFLTADLSLVSEKAFKKALIIKNGKAYDADKIKYNAVRLGFASLNFTEQEKAVEVLKEIVCGAG